MNSSNKQTFILAAVIAGLLLLIVGANALVKGASRLAAAFRVAPLIIGLTVVAVVVARRQLLAKRMR